MSQVQRISPYLWYDDAAEAAAHLYVSVFPNSRILNIQRIPIGRGESEAIVEFELDGQRFTAFDGGTEFSLSPAVSFVVSCETQEEIDYYWFALSEGGEQQVGGWLRDRYGLSWQVLPTELMGLIKIAPMPVMMALIQMGRIEIEPLRQAAEHSNDSDAGS